MIKPEQIPDGAVWEFILSSSSPNTKPAEQIAAALNAWFGSEVLWFGKGPSLILPLNQESVDDEA